MLSSGKNCVFIGPYRNILLPDISVSISPQYCVSVGRYLWWHPEWDILVSWLLLPNRNPEVCRSPTQNYNFYYKEGEVFHHPSPPSLSVIFILLNSIHFHSTGVEGEIRDIKKKKNKVICLAQHHYSRMRKCILMIWLNRPFNNFTLRQSDPVSPLPWWVPPPPSPFQPPHTPLHDPLVRPALIQALISTLIHVLFREHRDCLMIYWPDLPICTANHKEPSTKEEPVGQALLSGILNPCPLHLPCSQSPCSFAPRRD